MSVRIGLLPPTLTNSWAWMTRRSLACSGKGSSLISSMKSVPVWASAKTPFRCSTAPVKDPRRWPKSWLSMRPSGTALVDGPGNELFAGAAFAHDADIGVPARHLVDLGQDLSELSRLPDDP